MCKFGIISFIKHKVDYIKWHTILIICNKRIKSKKNDWINENMNVIYKDH